MNKGIGLQLTYVQHQTNIFHSHLLCIKATCPQRASWLQACTNIFIYPKQSLHPKSQLWKKLFTIPKNWDRSSKNHHRKRKKFISLEKKNIQQNIKVSSLKKIAVNQTINCKKNILYQNIGIIPQNIHLEIKITSH